jgi:uncharacterized protein (DUF1697 family)
MAPLMRYVALFRGINVGKAKRIAMADLRVLLTKLGYTDVQTLLNSGNAVFTGDAAPSAKHADRIRQAVLKKTGVDAMVIVKSAKDMAGVIAGNELGPEADDHSRLLVALCNDAKSLAAVKKLANQQWGNEKLHIGKHAAYLWCADGILESKVAVALLKGLEGTGTTRNWATLNKIHTLIGDKGVKSKPKSRTDER